MEKFAMIKHKNSEDYDDASEIAIIAFWEIDKKKKFWRCRHFFVVPNPLAREVTNSGSRR